jgi:glucose-6-phosphate isomerase
MHRSGQVHEIIRMLQKNNSKRSPLSSLLVSDAHRFEQFSCQIPGLLFDFSRTALSGNDFSALLALAEMAGVKDACSRLFAGEPVNGTENRAVLHSLWRDRNFHLLLTNSEAQECRQSLERMRNIASAIHQGHLPPGEDSPGHRFVTSLE